MSLKLSSLNKNLILYYTGKNNVVPVNIVDSGADCETLPVVLGKNTIGSYGTITTNQTFSGRESILKFEGDGVSAGNHLIYTGAHNKFYDKTKIKIEYDYYIPSGNVNEISFSSKIYGPTMGNIRGDTYTITDSWEHASDVFTITGELDYIYQLNGFYNGIHSESLYMDNLKVEIYKLADKSTKKRHGIINGVTFGTDRKGKANNSMVFDGSSYIDCGTSLDYTDKLTVVFWVKSDVSTKFLLAKGDYLAVPKYDIAFLFFNTIGLRFYYGNTLYSDLESSTANMGEYYFLAITIDGTTIQCQRNNILHAAKTLSTTIPNTSLDLFIGAIKNGTHEITGNIDKVLIYNTILTLNEKNHLYNSYNSGAKVSTLKKGLLLDMSMNSTYYNTTTNKFNDKTPAKNLSTNYSGTVSANYTEMINGQYIEFDSALIPATDDFTLSFWYNPLGSYHNTSYLFCQNDNSSVGRFMFYLIAAGNIIFYTYDFGQLNSTFTLDLNTFNLITLRREGNNFKFFKNKSIDSATLVTSGSLFTGSSSAIAYRGYIGGAKTFQGYVAKYKVWNRGTSEQEISQLFDSERGLFEV